MVEQTKSEPTNEVKVNQLYEELQRIDRLPISREDKDKISVAAVNTKPDGILDANEAAIYAAALKRHVASLPDDTKSLMKELRLSSVFGLETSPKELDTIVQAIHEGANSPSNTKHDVPDGAAPKTPTRIQEVAKTTPIQGKGGYLA